jgi:addiction module HigA family antidote
MSGDPPRDDGPGALLRTQILPALNLTVSQAARDLQVTRQTLHRVLSGQAAISTDMAVRLEKFCGVSSEFWLSRQQSQELSRARENNRSLLPKIPSHTLPHNVFQFIGAGNVG